MSPVVGSDDFVLRSITRPPGGEVQDRLHLTGDLDAEAALSLRCDLDAIISDPPPSLVIDLSELESLDGAGLVAVTSAILEMRRLGRQAELIPPHRSSPRRILDLTGLAPLLSMAG